MSVLELPRNPATMVHMIFADGAELVSSISAVATAVMAVAAGVVAIWTLVQLKRDSRERTRPVMSAELRPRLLSHGTAELAIANVGRSVAMDVHVVFSPELPDLELHDGSRSMASFLRRRYEQPIPALAPGRELINMYGRMVGDGTHQLAEPGMPFEFTIAFSYQDSRGKSYCETYPLTVQTLMNETTSSPSNQDDRGMRRRLITALETIARGVGRR